MSINKKQTKLIALYFPQLHAIPENDEWWGKGFTDWDNVKSGLPQFEGHYQPRVPLNQNYYDQSRLDVVKSQVELAKSHGIYGFCHYHYWFDGKQLLETPTNLMLEHKDIDFPFCLSWANETWSRRWDGRDYKILIQQTHPPTFDSWQKHYDYLIKFWKDPRAIKVNGKPVFVIYRPQRIEKIDEMLTFWRSLAIKDGLPGLYFIFQKQYELPNRDCLAEFDAAFQFQPFEAVYSASYDKSSIRHTRAFKLFRMMPDFMQDILRGLKTKYFQQLTFHNYESAWRQIVKIRPDSTLVTFPGAFVDWDNTARYKNRATLFVGASPQAFRKSLIELLESMPRRDLPENYIFLNAWNEWSEGTYLEPDEKYGYEYINVIKSLLVDEV